MAVCGAFSRNGLEALVGNNCEKASFCNKKMQSVAFLKFLPKFGLQIVWIICITIENSTKELLYGTTCFPFLRAILRPLQWCAFYCSDRDFPFSHCSISPDW